MKELRQIRNAVIEALSHAGLEAEAAFPGKRVEKHRGAFATVSVGAAEGKAIGFCNYLGECRDEGGNVRELYGKQLEGVISVEIRAEGAEACEDGCEAASGVLLNGLPVGIRPGELKWEALCWDKNLQLFLRRGELSCSALFTASVQEEGEFFDFILKGVLLS